MKTIKTALALSYVDSGMNPFAAAKKAELAPNALYVALKKRRVEQAERCPCCGQPAPDGFLLPNSTMETIAKYAADVKKVTSTT